MYGSKCNCPGCHVTELTFLTLDHVNNDGYKYKRSTGDKLTGYRLCVWARKHKYPKSLQVLCANCQLGKAINSGVCPLHGKPH